MFLVSRCISIICPWKVPFLPFLPSHFSFFLTSFLLSPFHTTICSNVFNMYFCVDVRLQNACVHALVHMHFNVCILDCVMEHMICRLNMYSPLSQWWIHRPALTTQSTKNANMIHLFNKYWYKHLLCSRCASGHLGCIRKQTDKSPLLLNFTIPQNKVENKQKDLIHK